MRDRFRKKLAALVSKKLKRGDYNQVSLNFIGANAVIEAAEEPEKKEEPKQQGG